MFKTIQRKVKVRFSDEGLDEAKNSSNTTILKWIDYSKKYGIAYTLSDNRVGVIFNDKTSLVFDNEGKLFQIRK